MYEISFKCLNKNVIILFFILKLYLKIMILNSVKNFFFEIKLIMNQKKNYELIYFYTCFVFNIIDKFIITKIDCIKEINWFS